MKYENASCQALLWKFLYAKTDSRVNPHSSKLLVISQVAVFDKLGVRDV